MKPSRPKEWQEQQTLVEHLRAAGIKVVHIPNGEARPKVTTASGKTYSPTGVKLKKMGVEPNFPDLLITSRVPNWDHVRAVLVEMKRDAKEKVPAEQLRYHDELRADGFVVLVGYGYDDAVEKLRSAGFRL